MNRVEQILQDSFYQECMIRNQAKEVDRKFCKHTIQHVIDVARIAYIIMMESGDLNRFIEEHGLAGRPVGKEIIYAAALLHDIGRWQEYETGKDHASLGASLAVEILERAGFNRGEVRIITCAIREHRNIEENMSLLGERLYRADNLSRICSQCEANYECYKFDDMETGKKALIY